MAHLLEARDLVNDPRLVFMDEPTTGLDPQVRRKFWGLIEIVLLGGMGLLLVAAWMFRWD
jgi:ABC-2 type transport system ATP-binding protein